MKKSFLFTIVAFLLVYAPPAFASPLLTPESDLDAVIKSLLGLFARIVPLLIGAAVVFFLYGILVFIAKSSTGDADGRKEAINFMVFGIIGIAVMVSLWGLVSFVTSTLGTKNFVPQFNTVHSSADIHRTLV